MQISFTRWHLGQEISSDDTTRSAEPVENSVDAPLQTIQRLLMALLVLASAYTVYLIKPLLAPIILAAFVATCVSPLVDILARYIPRVLATLLIIGGLLFGLFRLFSLLLEPARLWLQDAPNATLQLTNKLERFVSTMADSAGARALMNSELFSAAGATESTGIPAWSAWAALAVAPGWITPIFSALLLSFFFTLHGGHMFRRLVELSPTLTQKKNVVGIVRAIQADSARYFLTTTTINLSLGSVTALMLTLFGVRDPLLWGAVVAILNFIPYLGPLTSTLLLALVGLLQFNSIGAALLPALSFFGLAILEGQLLAPLILGNRLSLSPVAILVWLMLWGWLWGIAGVFLGVPLLMCLKLTCERLPSWRWLARSLE